ncbi:PD-(D/E)XK nuclease family protein [Thiocapsa roseopersicina]|uniref:PD-(D/E)XK nuclease superfamily protein n=1 Tax=Thiocapsa roseopersicina TaxID=1058 RepID=A0A1H3DX63_THIRO|nr:PD-(D/E)XK nuclease family protein [Thiocapsa roseopersicina]SDX70937.1 PD-(D/E)XK nuclease superfamily protein [Thiocapsa roseopersicina]
MDPNLRALSQVPRKIWDSGPASWYFDLLTDRVTSAIPSLAAMPVHPWAELRQDVIPFYGDIESPRHAFSVEPLDWGGRLLERQVTETLCHYLDPKTGSHAAARCAVFLQTLFDLSGAPPIDTTKADRTGLRIFAEFHIDGRKKSRRIDLLIEMVQNGDIHAAVLEFKFEHHATKGQLDDIEKWTNKNYNDISLFFIVPDISAHKNIQDQYRNWKVLSWHTLLRRLELNMQAASAKIDDEQYRSFRRTMFRRATGG